MNYWPLSAMLRSRELQPEQELELMSLGTPQAYVSHETMMACRNLACKLPACGSMAIICSEGVPMRRVYLEQPTAENWIALERGGFVTAFNNFGFVMDALH